MENQSRSTTAANHYSNGLESSQLDEEHVRDTAPIVTSGQHFQLRSRRFLLTYSRKYVPTQTLLLMLDSLLGKYQMKCNIWHELHKDGTPHTHALVRTSKQPKVSSLRPLAYQYRNPNVRVPQTGGEHWKRMTRYHLPSAKKPHTRDWDTEGNYCDPLVMIPPDIPPTKEAAQKVIATLSTGLPLSNLLTQDIDTSHYLSTRIGWAKELIQIHESKPTTCQKPTTYYQHIIDGLIADRKELRRRQQQNGYLSPEERAACRKVHWFWSEAGGVGKTWTCHYLQSLGATVSTSCDHRSNAMIISSRTEIYALNVARNTPKDKTPFSFLEGLCDGIITSDKYMSATKIMPVPPLVFVFSNDEPLRQITDDKGNTHLTLSPDRWDVHHIISLNGS